MWACAASEAGVPQIWRYDGPGSSEKMDAFERRYNMALLPIWIWKEGETKKKQKKKGKNRL